MIIVGIVAAAVLLPILFHSMPANHPPASDTASNTSSGTAGRIEVVYFHRTQRCYSCRYVEAETRYTVETYFEDELASGTVTFQVINIQDEANADIVKKYGAYTSSLFINTVRDGTDHIEETIDLYLLIGRDEAFGNALRSKIQKSLEGDT